MKSRIMQVVFPLIAAVIILTGALAFGGLSEFTAQFKPSVDYETAQGSEYEAGRLFKGDIYAVLDSFASYETWEEDNFTGKVSNKKTTHEYFIVPAGDYEYIAVKVKSGEADAFYDISDATYDWLMGETEFIDADPVYREAVIEKMDDELYGYYMGWFKDTEFLGTTSESEIEPYLLPYVISAKDYHSSLTTFYICAAVFFIGIICIIIAIVFAAKRNKRYKAQMAGLAQQAAAGTEGAPAIPLQTDSSFGAQDTANQQEFNYEDYYNNASK